MHTHPCFQVACQSSLPPPIPLKKHKKINCPNKPSSPYASSSSFVCRIRPGPGATLRRRSSPRTLPSPVPRHTGHTREPAPSHWGHTTPLYFWLASLLAIARQKPVPEHRSHATLPPPRQFLHPPPGGGGTGAASAGAAVVSAAAGLGTAAEVAAARAAAAAAVAAPRSSNRRVRGGAVGGGGGDEGDTDARADPAAQVQVQRRGTDAAFGKDTEGGEAAGTKASPPAGRGERGAASAAAAPLAAAASRDVWAAGLGAMTSGGMRNRGWKEMEMRRGDWVRAKEVQERLGRRREGQAHDAEGG